MLRQEDAYLVTPLYPSFPHFFPIYVQSALDQQFDRFNHVKQLPVWAYRSYG